MDSANFSENKKHDQVLIPYVGGLDLDQAPFTTNASGQFFYTDPEIKQYLNLLRHLTQSSNLIPVVLSPKGGGKSSLLQAFIEESESNSKICKIDANHFSNKAHLLKEIAKCFNIDNDTSEADLLHLLHKETTSLYQNSKYPVIAIENAQHLQDDACKLLLSLQQGLEDKINTWHVLFFADCISGEPPKLYNIDLSRHPQLHILLIEPYTLEQTKNYISHRLAAAGYIGDCPLTDEALNYIYHKSKGLPGIINELTHSALLKLPTQNMDAYPSLQTETKNSYSPFKRILFLALLVLGTVTALYMQDDINALFEFNDQEQKRVVAKKNNDNKPVTKTDASSLSTEAHIRSTSNEPVTQEEGTLNPQTNNIATNTIISSVTVTPKTIPTKEVKSAIVSNMEIKNPDEKPYENNSENKPQKILASDNISNSRVQKLLPEKIHREDWLLKQKDKYTVRLLGTLKEKIITTYLNENIIGRKLGHEISYYLTEKDGQYKHTLLYGVFPTYSQAKEVIKNLPKNLKLNGPWPVKLDGIKKSITLYRKPKLVTIEKPTQKELPVIKKAAIETKKVQNNIGAPTNSQGLHNEINTFLKGKDSDSFTVQLLSTGSKSPLLSYMKKYKLGDKSVLYKTTRNEKEWYVLFYGVFKTRRMAESFVNTLPKDARSGGPWIRKMSDLQKISQANSN